MNPTKYLDEVSDIAKELNKQSKTIIDICNVLELARGTGSGIDWRAFTEKQLKEWGVKYHELHFGRIITDWAKTPEDFLNEV